MDARSEAELAQIMPEVATMIRSAAVALATQGTFLCVYGGLRTAAMQVVDYAQGRTTRGHIITNAHPAQSMHCYGLAADIVPYLRAEGGTLNWNPRTPQFQTMIIAMKAAGLEAGADWKGDLCDEDHFQFAGFGPTPTQAMQADFAANLATAATPQDETGALANIWIKVRTGVYGS